jgi:arylsulfatase A-like enzyme
MARPNLIYIFPDQLSACWTSVYGNSRVYTPRLDSLAAESLVFERAYTSSPLCTPYRGTLFTGRLPIQTGISQVGDGIPKGEVPLAALLNEGGYRTSYVGKWHLSGKPHANRWVPPEARGGFQDFLGWESHHVDHWKGLIWGDDPDLAIELKGHETDGLTDLACGKIRELSGTKEKPFALFISYQAPHPPCNPPDSFLKMYEGKDLFERLNMKRDAWLKYPAWKIDYSVQDFLERYLGEVSQMDAAVGRLLDTVDEAGLRDDTIIIFTSDHGEMAGCHGKFGKQVMYEEAIRVPLIVRHPSGPRGKRTTELFSTIDFLPTILDLCSVESHSGAEGLSHAHLIRGEQQKEVNSSVFISEKELCIRRAGAKIVTDYSGSEVRQLFDLETDPYEMRNLAGDPSAATLQEDLHKELLARRDDYMSRKEIRRL